MTERTIVITGASGGIGSALVRRFLADGEAVVALDLTDEGLARLRNDLGSPAALDTYACDITDEKAVFAFAEHLRGRGTGVDVLINCAGYFPPQPFEEITFAAWRRVLSINLDGVFLMTHALLPLMKAKGQGRILNIGSSSFFAGTALYTHYVAAKAGVIGFTRSLAREVGKYGITCNVVAPGLTSTDIVKRSAPGQLIEERKQQRAIQREQYAEDLVGTIAFMCSAEAGFITGQTVNVDGGAVMH